MYLVRLKEYDYDLGYFVEKAQVKDTLQEALDFGLEYFSNIRKLGKAFDEEDYQVYECTQLNWEKLLNVQSSKTP